MRSTANSFFFLPSSNATEKDCDQPLYIANRKQVKVGASDDPRQLDKISEMIFSCDNCNWWHSFPHNIVRYGSRYTRRMMWVTLARVGGLRIDEQREQKLSWFCCTSNAFLIANGIQSLFQSSWVDVISPTRDSIASNRRRWSPEATAISDVWEWTQ